MFLSIEGVEFVGKSILADSLAKSLSQTSQPVVRTYEPGGTPMANAIRKVFKHDWKEDIFPNTELYLILAARWQHVGNVIMPALRAGSHVVCDRYIDSTIAYQGQVFGDQHIVRTMRNFRLPELTFLLTADLPTRLERFASRAGSKHDRFDEMVEDQELYQDRFMVIAGRNPRRIVHIDTTSLTEQEVFKRADEIMLRRL